MAKQFLTLILGSLVLSVTFSEKIVSFTTANGIQQACLIFSWLLLMVSLGMAGYGLYLIFLATEQASGSVIYDYASNFKDITRRSYGYLDKSAFIYGAGLVLLVVAAVINFVPTRAPHQTQPTHPKAEKRDIQVLDAAPESRPHDATADGIHRA